jgi:predicted O-methyltransferase YrrM
MARAPGRTGLTACFGEDELLVSERLPDNLELLYSAFSREAIDAILPGDSFRVDDVEFVCKYSPESTAGRFFIVKPLALVDQYREVCRRFEGGTIFELGIAEGGSTALLALLARPSKLIAVDLERQPLAALAEFADAHGLSDIVRPYYGIDQSDRKRLAEIVEAELGDASLDLVIDDASHQLGPTRSSFETLFPRLRPGGLFVIEDWRADHIMRDAVIASLRDASSGGRAESAQKVRESVAGTRTGERSKPDPPLSQLAIELVLARAALGNAIADVSVGEFCLIVRRGDGDLDPGAFRVADLFVDYFGFLPKDASEA